jgi:hypothetical protein
VAARTIERTATAQSPRDIPKGAGPGVPHRIAKMAKQRSVGQAKEIAARVRRFLARRITVKLRGRPGAPTQRRWRTMFPSARGADTQAVHGPLQRLLAVATVDLGRNSTTHPGGN